MRAHNYDEVCQTCGRDAEERRRANEWAKPWMKREHDGSTSPGLNVLASWKAGGPVYGPACLIGHVPIGLGIHGTVHCSDCGTFRSFLVRRDGEWWFPIFDLWLENGTAIEMSA